MEQLVANLDLQNEAHNGDTDDEIAVDASVSQSKVTSSIYFEASVWRMR